MNLREEILDIIDITAKKFNVSAEDIIGKYRNREYVWPRQIAQTVAYYLLNDCDYEEMFANDEKPVAPYLSLKETGRVFGNRDHSTVIHSMNTVRDLIQVERGRRGSLGSLERVISEVWNDSLIAVKIKECQKSSHSVIHDEIVDVSKKSIEGFCLQVLNPQEVFKNTPLNIAEI